MGPFQRREQILAVATQHFERFSYSDVSTQAIAHDAGVGRPLINHYFGTKRELYLEVVRRLAIVPTHVPGEAVRGIPASALELRIEASIDYWLAVASRHQFVWTSTIISAEAPIRDPEIAEILAQAESVAAVRMLEALGLAEHPQHERLHVMLLTFGALAIRASRQWLIHKTLSRDEVSTLLSRTLLTIVCDVVPQIAAQETSQRQSAM
ncbi:MAG: TetR/AcrR family transcriptional regulator [Mycobacterium sp.]|nr:TetR/AcrR family transcriptional regulator [Mycobacterium sp.]MDR3662964.1 TetR/AcrR family transcriptional regulator [Mycobacterium sp.]